MKNYLKIKARVVLTEIPIDVNIKIDTVLWLTVDEMTQASAVWQHIAENYPLALEVAENNTKNWPKTSWIENIEVIGDNYDDY